MKNLASVVHQYTKSFVGAVVALVVAVSMIPVLALIVANASGSVTGPAAFLLGLITFFVVVGIILFVVNTLY